MTIGTTDLNTAAPSPDRKGVSALSAVLLGLACAAAGAAGGWFASDSMRHATRTRVPSNAATTHVRPSEDCGPLTFGVDGTFAPLTCPDGNPNVHAIDLYRSYGALAIDLGPDASPGQVSRALCADLGVQYGTIPKVQDEYTLAVARFGWRMPLDPSTDEELSNCRR